VAAAEVKAAAEADTRAEAAAREEAAAEEAAVASDASELAAWEKDVTRLAAEPVIDETPSTLAAFETRPTEQRHCSKAGTVAIDVVEMESGEHESAGTQQLQQSLRNSKTARTDTPSHEDGWDAVLPGGGHREHTPQVEPPCASSSRSCSLM
jgi:hypothetical protein